MKTGSSQNQGNSIEIVHVLAPNTCKSAMGTKAQNDKVVKQDSTEEFMNELPFVDQPLNKRIK